MVVQVDRDSQVVQDFLDSQDTEDLRESRESRVHLDPPPTSIQRELQFKDNQVTPALTALLEHWVMKVLQDLRGNQVGEEVIPLWQVVQVTQGSQAPRAPRGREGTLADRSTDRRAAQEALASQGPPGPQACRDDLVHRASSPLRSQGSQVFLAPEDLQETEDTMDRKGIWVTVTAWAEAPQGARGQRGPQEPAVLLAFRDARVSLETLEHLEVRGSKDHLAVLERGVSLVARGRRESPTTPPRAGGRRESWGHRDPGDPLETWARLGEMDSLDSLVSLDPLEMVASAPLETEASQDSLGLRAERASLARQGLVTRAHLVPVGYPATPATAGCQGNPAYPDLQGPPCHAVSLATTEPPEFLAHLADQVLRASQALQVVPDGQGSTV